MRKQIFILGVAMIGFLVYSPAVNATAFQCIDAWGSGFSGPVNCGCDSGSACRGGNSNLDSTTCNVVQACGAGYSCARTGTSPYWCNSVHYNLAHCTANSGTWYATSDFDSSAGGSVGCCSNGPGRVTEIGGDNYDNDCDGAIDEGSSYTWYADVDQDGHGDSTKTSPGTASAPAANWAVDYDGSAANGDEWWITDGDGACFVSPCRAVRSDLNLGADCNHFSLYAWTGRSETCDSQDNNCNGTVDEGVKTTYYRDADGDTRGISSTTQQACSMPSGYVTNSNDCNDNEPLAWTGKTEICWDNVDNDCNGSRSEIAACDTGNFYKLDNNTSANLQKWSICNLVISNNTGRSIFIPMKTVGEWSSFVTNFSLATVTKAICSL